MPRTLKPQKVDEVRNEKTGATVPIMFDRNSMEFFADIGGVEVRSDTAAECKTAARKKIADFAGYEWEPIILISVRDRATWQSFSRKRRAGLDFEFWRVERAKQQDGEHWIERPFLDGGLIDGDTDRVPVRSWDTSGPMCDRTSGQIENARVRNLSRRKTDEDIEPHHSSASYVTVPYTSETWAALLTLRARVEEAEKTLREMMKTENVQAALSGVTSSLKLLPAEAGVVAGAPK